MERRPSCNRNAGRENRRTYAHLHSVTRSLPSRCIDAENQGRMDEAQHAFGRAIAADPFLIDARQNLA
jgi:hypothetical protein